jgi:uncharacterized phage protein gp47/JayE
LPTASEIAARMVTALKATEPDLDSSVGTPLRKIFDAVAESIAEAYTDQHLIQYTYDIDSKTGGDLDDFVALFGFARIPAQRAQGIVTFSRANDSNATQTALVIPPGTQVVALTSPPVYVQTTVSAVLNPAQTSVDVPVQAVVAGTAGNVAAGLLTSLVSVTGTLRAANNVNALSGGTAQESDDALRARFRQTVFRSLAGTLAMYQAVALEVPRDPSTPLSPAVTQVNVLGSSKRWREQVQVVSGTAVTSLVGAAYIFADNVFCGTNIDGGSMLSLGADYTFTPSNPTNRTDATATLASLGASMPDGFYDLDFEYVPQASRNDPGNTRFGQGGINNRIDIWCNGQVSASATQSIVFSTAKVFSATSTSPYYTGRFARDRNDGAPNPSAGDVFIPLAFGPIVSLPATISAGAVTYTLGVDYWPVHQSDGFGYGPTSLFGLAWRTANKPANGTVFSLTYVYNKVARLVEDAITQWRLVGTDARAHCGRAIPLRFHLAVMYDRRYDPAAVKTEVDSTLAAFLAGLGFDAPLQVSDVLQVVHNVPGVDNVRFLTSADDSVNFAMAKMSSYQTNTQLSVFATSGRARDIQFADDEYPVFHSTRIVQKASNSFGVS